MDDPSAPMVIREGVYFAFTANHSKGKHVLIGNDPGEGEDPAEGWHIATNAEFEEHINAIAEAVAADLLAEWAKRN